MRALDWVLGGLRAVAQLPVRAGEWLVDNVARCLAVAWLGGMAFVIVVLVQRIVRADRQEAALEAAAGPEAHAPVHGDGPPEVVQLMDVDEMDAIEKDRMHALGLAAAGDSGDPDQAAIDAARERRGKSADVDGEQVGGAGKVVVVSKGGIAGWIQRNKGKRADPETLAWLRAEEAADGRAAYAAWADAPDGDLMGWLVRNKRGGRGAGGAEPAGGSVVAGEGGSGSGSADDSGSGSAHDSGSGSGVDGAVAARASARPPIDVFDLGAGAVLAAAPELALAQRQADASALRTTLATAPATHALEPALRGHRIEILLPADVLFGGDEHATELTAGGAATIRKLGAAIAALRDRDVELVGRPYRALDVAGQLIIGGVDPDHVALAARGDDDTPLELVILEPP